jgi:hypothetical protein
LSIRFDFLESGVGETILITFPDGSVGVVDSHPAFDSNVRALELIDGKILAFVHLTHPHLDHGKGLIPILEKHPQINEFWHTVSGIQQFVYSLEDIPVFPSHIRQTVDDYMSGSGNFVRQLFGTVARRKIPSRTLHARVAPIEISGVKIHVLAPDESSINEFQTAYTDISANKRKNIPDLNTLSSILVLEYGKQVILLGGDALKKSWLSATKTYRSKGFPKSRLLKIPHHGASNAFDLNANESATYLGMCDKNGIGVLFAGDLKHPDKRVEERIKKRLDLHCVVNGARHSHPRATANPLNLNLPGARAAKPNIKPCQDAVSFEIDEEGDIKLVTGMACAKCIHAH